MSNREKRDIKVSVKESTAEFSNNNIGNNNNVLRNTYVIRSHDIPMIKFSFRRNYIATLRVNLETWRSFKEYCISVLRMRPGDVLHLLMTALIQGKQKVEIPNLDLDLNLNINVNVERKNELDSFDQELVADEVERLRIENRRLRESFKFWKREASTIGKRMKELLAKLKHTKSLLEAAETAMKSSLEVIEDPEYSPDHKLTAIKRLLSEAYLKIRRGGIGD